MSDAIVAGALSFAAAVIAVIVGQVLAGRFQSTTEQRRWQREDAARWRIRSEAMAREAIDGLATATEFVGWSGSRKGAAEKGLPEEEWVRPKTSDVADLVRPVRRAALEIAEPGIRDHLAKATDVLVNGQAASQFGAPALTRIAWAAQQTSNAVIGAYLRGETLPTRAGAEGSAEEDWIVFGQATEALADMYSAYFEESDWTATEEA